MYKQGIFLLIASSPRALLLIFKRLSYLVEKNTGYSYSKRDKKREAQNVIVLFENVHLFYKKKTKVDSSTKVY